MFAKYQYNLTSTQVTDTYIDFTVSTSGVSKISLSFFYRLVNTGEWRADATLTSLNPNRIVGNKIVGIELEDGECVFRWHYILNGIKYSDDIQVEVRPEPTFYVTAGAGDDSLEFALTSYGPGTLTRREGRGYFYNIGLKGNSLLYNGFEIFTELSNPSYAESFPFWGIQRMLVADNGNHRIVEVNEYGNLVKQYSPGASFEPIYCTYNRQTGRVLIVDETGPNAFEIYWNNVSTGLPHPSFGTKTWDYNTTFPAYPLPSLTSATYGADSGTFILTNAAQVVKVNGSTRVVKDSYVFKRTSGDDSTNIYTPSDLAVAFEYFTDKFVIVEKAQATLPYSSLESSHITFNRTLGENANFPIHKALYNDIFYPIKPEVSTETANIILTILNNQELKSSNQTAYENTDRTVPLFDGLSDDRSRGDIHSDIPQWGAREGYNVAKGIQTMVCMTGQQINVSIPYGGLRVGHSQTSVGLSPVFVQEQLSVSLIAVSTGQTVVFDTGSVFDSDVSFDFTIPRATPESYARAQAQGYHELYYLKVVSAESYYDTDQFETKVSEDRDITTYIPIYAFWWRQVLKEIDIGESPVNDFNFPLEDYAETPAQFFDYYTVYPSFRKTVGTTVVDPEAEQKTKIILDNAFALLSYYNGLCPGGAALSNLFGFDAAAYDKERSESINNLFRVDENPPDHSPTLPGLDADYQRVNVFADTPSGATSSQILKDFQRVLFVDEDNFSDDYGENGIVTIPATGDTIAAKLDVPDGNERLYISIDEDGLTVDSINISGEYSNTEGVRAGDRNITVSFTTSSAGIDEVIFGLSIDGSPMVVYRDIGGTLREYTFGAETTITSNSVVTGMILLKDSNGRSFTFYANENAFKESPVTTFNNVSVTVDRVGKSFSVFYDFYGKYDIIPYNVDLLAFLEGENFDVTSNVNGDIGAVFSGTDKRIVVSYGEILTEEEQRKEITATLSFVPVDSSEPVENYTFSFFLRAPDLWDDHVEEEGSLVISTVTDEIQPKIRATASIHDYLIEFSYPSYRMSFSSNSCSSSSDTYKLVKAGATVSLDGGGGFRFKGENGESATVLIGASSFTIYNDEEHLVWDKDGLGEHTFTYIGESIQFVVGSASITITWYGYGSLIFFVEGASLTVTMPYRGTFRVDDPIVVQEELDTISVSTPVFDTPSSSSSSSSYEEEEYSVFTWRD